MDRHFHLSTSATLSITQFGGQIFRLTLDKQANCFSTHPGLSAEACETTSNFPPCLFLNQTRLPWAAWAACSSSGIAGKVSDFGNGLCRAVVVRPFLKPMLVDGLVEGAFQAGVRALVSKPCF